jgi:flavin-dependent dehydrogenase
MEVMTARTYDSVVLGAGPAGIACATALARLGYRVALVGRPRSAVEGLSARTLQQLQAAELTAAVAAVSAPARRLAIWGEREHSGNVEFVVDRARFDAALARDAARHGIESRGPLACALRSFRRSWRVELPTGILQARSIVDARGRRPRDVEKRGPPLAAYSRALRIHRDARFGTATFPVEKGWCWLANTGPSRWVLQFVGEPRRGGHSPLETALASSARIPAPALALLRAATADGDSTVRAATATFASPAPKPGMLRIGDACIAMDPLSGHGIFEALASARVGAAVIHTYLASGQWDTAAQFARERAEEIWQRKMSTAADFYAAQDRAIPRTFWQHTAAAYTALARRSASAPERRVELRPVLDGMQIMLRRVLVTPEHARGIWRINGREITC